MKICPHCWVAKPLAEFYTSYGKPRYCKPCWITMTRSHPKFKEWQRISKLRRLHRLTPDAFAALLAAQGGRCAICGTDERPKKNWHIDHDHTTGRIRGLLCVRCNNALGLLGENPATFDRAAAYLRQ